MKTFFCFKIIPIYIIILIIILIIFNFLNGRRQPNCFKPIPSIWNIFFWPKDKLGRFFFIKKIRLPIAAGKKLFWLASLMISEQNSHKFIRLIITKFSFNDIWWGRAHIFSTRKKSLLAALKWKFLQFSQFTLF